MSFSTPVIDPPIPAKQPVSEARRAHLRVAGQKGNARRRVLSGDDARALGQAYQTLERIVQKYRIDVPGAS